MTPEAGQLHSRRGFSSDLEGGWTSATAVLAEAGPEIRSMSITHQGIAFRGEPRHCWPSLA